MAKLGKLTKLKSAIKRWPSFPKLGSGGGRSTTSDNQLHHSRSADHNQAEQSLHAVYVGKSRRRYLVSSDVLEHPVFQELVDRSASESEEDGGAVVVACEVVLFEHLLWMLENAETQMGSMHELAELYTCAC
ncbi:auxin-responsive protein SAUR78-like [Neltuma alba]|uniref:auxin-responsive protein SAUR78-like n=1 Tax=Neltuma alba TaxID=207710 RepID=UPI0010A38DCC|nr:auxin-responsive protein SAUR78-like [Prosopis alba]